MSNYCELSFFLTTIGRPTLTNMLDSLLYQLDNNDNVYIFIDGKQYWQNVDLQLSKIHNFKCNIHTIYEKETLGFWGHALRNKYQRSLAGDYILHCDDDDIYIKNSISTIKNSGLDKEFLSLFKFYLNFNKNDIVWEKPILEQNKIGTPCGVIPNVPYKFGYWEYRYGGDFTFYNSCKFRLKFIDEIIYVNRPLETGYITSTYENV